MAPEIEAFLHKPTSTWSYVVADPDAGDAAVIDPVMDFDAASGGTAFTAADEIVAHLRERRLSLRWILETHAHADHLTAAAYLRDALGGRIAIGAGICRVQQTFKRLLNLGNDFAVDGRQFDRLLTDGERLAVGNLSVEIIATPGHTSDGLSYLIGDALFIGDTLFMPDVGTARCDFPGGDAATLYDSIRRLLSLPDETRMFMLHDYPPSGREIACETTVGAQRAHNIHVRDGVNREEFVALRTRRDATLPVPKLLYPALQINLRGGRLPPPDANGVAYLKLPLKTDL